MSWTLLQYNRDAQDKQQMQYPLPQALKIPEAEAAVEKELEKTRENTGMAAEESQKEERGDR